MSKISQSLNFIKDTGSFYLCLGPYLCSTQYHSAQEEAPSISKETCFLPGKKIPKNVSTCKFRSYTLLTFQ